MEWRIVFTTTNSAEAQVIAGRLRAEQIPVMVHQEAGGRALGITVGRLGEVTVLVRPDDYERAITILEPEAPEELPDSTNSIIYPFGDDDEPYAD
ncbi:MAG: DUF2007 domain-containing protein [Chloroflexi bacterium]|nr:DUF2007 domain-containing protein [Chloroflexota bacterium]